MRVLLHSGGVAFAQPPATSFYPCQDADFPKGYHSNATVSSIIFVFLFLLTHLGECSRGNCADTHEICGEKTDA